MHRNVPSETGNVELCWFSMTFLPGHIQVFLQGAGDPTQDL